MKSLPPGNYALSIAHPGHELRLHGFMEQANPFVWILTDGSDRTGMEMITHSVLAVHEACFHNVKKTVAFFQSDASKKLFFKSDRNAPKGQEYIKDSQVHNEIVNKHTDFFVDYINSLADKFIKWETDYLVSDSIENTDVCHDITGIMSAIAIDLVKKRTRKKIMHYDYAITKKYDENINDDCICIKLDDEAIERKLNAIIKYPLAVMDLKPNIYFDHNLIIELGKLKDGKEQVKQFLKEINYDFLKYEYLRPYKFKDIILSNTREKLSKLILEDGSN